jgi:hypothetical protein
MIASMIRYHEAALALLGITGATDSAAVATLAAIERQLKISLPKALVDWYSVPGAPQYLVGHTSDDIVPLEQLGQPVPNWFGSGPRDFSQRGLLLIRAENQGVCHWAIPLDQGDDPPVLVEVDTAPNERWLPHAARFSTWAYVQAWEVAAARMPVQAVAAGQPRGNLPTLLRVRDTFEALDSTFGWPGDRQERLYRDGVRIIAWHEEAIDWSLYAESVELLHEAIRSLRNCGVDLREPDMVVPQ